MHVRGRTVLDEERQHQSEEDRTHHAPRSDQRAGALISLMRLAASSLSVVGFHHGAEPSP
jgi:hypothetical protein